MERRDLERRAHAGPAVDRDLVRLGHPQRRVPRAQLRGRPERAIRGEGVRGGRAPGTRDVTRTRIPRLDLPAVPLPRAGVEQHAAERDTGGAVLVDHGEEAGGQRHVAGRRHNRAGLERQAGGCPGGQGAVEDPHVGDAGVAQQPPRPRRREAASAVVRDDRVPRPDAPPARGLLQRRGLGQRMPPLLGSAVSRQLGVEVGVRGTRDVPGLVQRTAGRAAERPPDVEHAHVVAGAQGMVELGGRDEDLHHPMLAARCGISPAASRSRPSS
jgi:hypothetical protein